MGQKRWAQNSPYVCGSCVLAFVQLQIIFTAWGDVFCATLQELDPGFIFFPPLLEPSLLFPGFRSFISGRAPLFSLFSSKALALPLSRWAFRPSAPVLGMVGVFTACCLRAVVIFQSFPSHPRAPCSSVSRCLWFDCTTVAHF